MPAGDDLAIARHRVETTETNDGNAKEGNGVMEIGQGRVHSEEVGRVLSFVYDLSMLHTDLSRGIP